MTQVDNKWLEESEILSEILNYFKLKRKDFMATMTEEASAPVSENVPSTNPKDLSQVVQGTAENLLNKLEENLGEQKGIPSLSIFLEFILGRC